MVTLISMQLRLWNGCGLNGRKKTMMMIGCTGGVNRGLLYGTSCVWRPIYPHQPPPPNVDSVVLCNRSRDFLLPNVVGPVGRNKLFEQTTNGVVFYGTVSDDLASRARFPSLHVGNSH